MILEAQASGLPVVLSDSGEPKEYVRHGITGMVCPTGNVQALAHETAMLLRNPRRRMEMGAAARDHAFTCGGNAHWSRSTVLAGE